MPFELDIDVDELRHLADQLEVDKKAMMASARSAAIQAARWARVQTQRGLSARLGVPSGAVAKRANAKKRGSGARLWVGLDPLNIVVAKPTTTRSGLRAGREEFFGAFEAKGKYSAKPIALRRKGSARNPLESVAFDVAAAGTPLIQSQVWPGLNDRFLQLYKSELERRSGG
jgi:hypothetical protein